MTRIRRIALTFASLCLCILLAHSPTARAENWPQYRGPERTGIVTEKGLAQSWPDDGPKELWRAKTGIGFGSPIAVDGKVYAFFLSDGKDTLEAFDAKSGKSLWKQDSPTKYSGGYPGTRCTPVIDGDRIYTYGTSAELIARNLADGKQLWMIDVLAETGNRMNVRPQSWGNSSNPLIDGDFIYVQCREGGSAAACIDKKTGKLVWKSQAMGGGYASPVMAEVGGVKLLLCFANKHFMALDPKSGKTVWELNEDWETEFDINATMPIVHDGKAFISCAYKNGHCGLYELSPTGAKKIWGGKQIVSRFQAPILDNGYLYANSEGLLTCVRWDDGQVMWPKTPKRTDRNFLAFGGSLLRFGGDKLLCINSQNGATSLVKATPEGMTVIKTVKRFVEGDQIWSTPLIYDGKLYIKSKEELIAYDMSGK